MKEKGLQETAADSSFDETLSLRFRITAIVIAIIICGGVWFFGGSPASQMQANVKEYFVQCQITDEDGTVGNCDLAESGFPPPKPGWRLTIAPNVKMKDAIGHRIVCLMIATKKPSYSPEGILEEKSYSNTRIKSCD